MGKIVLSLTKIWIAILGLSVTAFTGAAELIDYGQLDHTISVDTLRAGNHDESGVNTYFFTATLHAIAMTKDESEKDFNARLKKSEELDSFGEIEIAALAHLTDTKQLSDLKVSGESIRILVSRAMRELKLAENQIAVSLVITMYENNKPFIVIGENTVVGEASYFIIPETLPHSAKIENQSLLIEDKLGAKARVAVTYLNLNKIDK